jgi:plastocyanin
VALAACGQSGTQRGRTVTLPAGRVVSIQARDYFFDPDRYVVAGGHQRIHTVLHNEGALEHDVRVFAGHRDIGGTPAFKPEQTRAATVDLAPGEYMLVCSVADHRELGMVGTLRVLP